jgi:hypothetical protein
VLWHHFAWHGGLRPRDETTPARLELNPAEESSHQKESHHGYQADKKEEDEEDDVMRAQTSQRGRAVNVLNSRGALSGVS